MSNSKVAARAAGLFGALAVLAIPAGAAAAQYSGPLGLLRALFYAVPAACALALIGLIAARRARLAAARSISGRRSRTFRVGRFFAWAGLYAGATGALALAIYALLRAAQ